MVDVRIGGRLLGRHVGRGAKGESERGEMPTTARGAHRLGHAEIGNDRVARGQEHVVRLDVPVHDAVGVGVGQRVPHFAQDSQRLRDGKLALGGKPHTQRLARDERHDVVEQVARGAGRQQRHDVGVLEPGGELDFPLEPLDVHPRPHFGRKHLDHHLTRQPRLLGQEDAAHATAAELAHDAVAVSDHRLQAGRELDDGQAPEGGDEQGDEKVEDTGMNCQRDRCAAYPPSPTSSAQASGSRLAPPTSTPSSSGRARSARTLP